MPGSMRTDARGAYQKETASWMMYIQVRRGERLVTTLHLAGTVQQQPVQPGTADGAGQIFGGHGRRQRLGGEGPAALPSKAR